MDLAAGLVNYEQGTMSNDDMIKLFQRLINIGLCWELQGHYARTAIRLIEYGLCIPKGEV